MGQGVLFLEQIKGPPWYGKYTRNLAILAYVKYIQYCVANIGGLVCINMLLLMSGGVKFVTGSNLASIPYHLNYSLYLSRNWVSAGRWTL